MKNVGGGGGWKKHIEEGESVEGILNQVDERHEHTIGWEIKRKWKETLGDWEDLEEGLSLFGL